MQRSKTIKQNRPTNQVRIIGGAFRSRKLSFPSAEGLRPTGDRIRETLFNWLAPYIAGSNCLDLFAGSGILGLEALSRGAGRVIFVDSAALVCESIRNNLNLLKINSSTVICSDSLSWLNKQNAVFDVIFVDPPFSDLLIEPACHTLETRGLTKSGTLIYIEDAASNPEPTLPLSWQLLKDKKTGNVRYRLYCRA